jgi:hypothetical protein
MRVSDMKAHDSMRAAISHTAAACAVVGVSLAFALVSYFGLLAWAVLAGLPLGGPLALPFLMLLALLTSTAATLLVLFPATLVGHFLCRRLGWPAAAEIPVSSALTLGIAVGISTVIGSYAAVSISTAAALGALVGAFLLVPLGEFWWVMRVSSWGVEQAHRLVERSSS